MKYEDIYSQFYSKIDDPTFFQKYSKDEAYELMKTWLKSVASIPRVKKCFSSLSFDDEIIELTYTLTRPIDDDYDYNFVKDVFSQGMAICWMRQKVDRIANYTAVVGGKEEKAMLNNYKANVQRLERLEIQLKKMIRDHVYYNGVGE